MPTMSRWSLVMAGAILSVSVPFVGLATSTAVNGLLFASVSFTSTPEPAAIVNVVLAGVE